MASPPIAASRANVPATYWSRADSPYRATAVLTAVSAAPWTVLSTVTRTWLVLLSTPTATPAKPTAPSSAAALAAAADGWPAASAGAAPASRTTIRPIPAIGTALDRKIERERRICSSLRALWERTARQAPTDSAMRNIASAPYVASQVLRRHCLGSDSAHFAKVRLAGAP